MKVVIFQVSELPQTFNRHLYDEDYPGIISNILDMGYTLNTDFGYLFKTWWVASTKSDCYFLQLYVVNKTMLKNHKLKELLLEYLI